MAMWWSKQRRESMSLLLTVYKPSNPITAIFDGIAWVENNDDNLAYAKQMGYDYVVYHSGMEDHAHSCSLKF
jgi:hypothetical protein